MFPKAVKNKPHIMRGKKRRERMKTKVLLAVTMLAGFAVSAQAATIIGSKHDLSNTQSGNSVRSTTQNQTCVFCHAPHNAVTNKLLWNRNAVATTMSVYTSYNSASMRTLMNNGNVLTSASTSLLCLSCHSLATASDIITGTFGTTGATTAAGTFSTKANNMSSLTNDHPVGIDYALAASTGNSNSNLFTVPASNKVTNAFAGTYNTARSLRLFNNANVSQDTMECGTCHSVHDNSKGKFLALTNTQSELCTTCHIK
jgi:predicted CXXCH cytochrome family protein